MDDRYYCPWLCPCSCRIESAVQSLLQKICRHESIEEFVNEEKSPKMAIVVWEPPKPTWIKVNTDGVSKGNPGLSACGGVFRSSSCDFLEGFAVSLGFKYAFDAEVMAIMYAIDIAHSKGWMNLWIESDALRVVGAIQNGQLKPPSQLKNLWTNCLEKMNNMTIYCSHIYREGNRVADKIANLGLRYPALHTWNQPPIEIRELLLDDYWGLPNFRFS